MHFVFMQIHLVWSKGIMCKLKTKKCNVTRAQRWMNTPLAGQYEHMQTQTREYTHRPKPLCL